MPWVDIKKGNKVVDRVEIPDENLEAANEDARKSGLTLVPVEMQTAGYEPPEPTRTEVAPDISVAPYGMSAFSSESKGSPLAAVALGISSGLGAGVPTAAATAAHDIMADPGPQRTREQGMSALPARERTAYEEAELIKEKHPLIYHGTELATLPIGLMGQLLKKGAAEAIKKAGTEKVGRLAAGKAAGQATAAEVGTRTAADIAAQSATAEPTEMFSIEDQAVRRERAQKAAMSMLMAQGAGYGLGALPGMMFPHSTMGLKPKGPDLLELPPASVALAKAEGRPDVGSKFAAAEPALARFEEGARTGEHPAELVAMEFEEKFVPVARARQIATKERIGGAERAYWETPQGETLQTHDELADTAWDIVKEMGYTDPRVRGKAMPGMQSARDRFRKELDSIADFEVDLRPGGIPELGTAETQLQGPGRLIPMDEAVEVLGEKRVSQIVEQAKKEVPEEMLNLEYIRMVPLAKDARQLEGVRKMYSEQAKEATKTAATETAERYKRLAAATRAGREKFEPHPKYAPAEERAVIETSEGEREVTGYAARMKNLADETAREEKLMSEGGFSKEIGKQGLSTNESKAFRNALRAMTLGEDVKQTRAIRAIAEEAGLGPDLTALEGELADIFLSSRYAKAPGMRLIGRPGMGEGMAMPYPIATFGIGPSEEKSLRWLAVERAITSRPKLHAFLKSIRATPIAPAAPGVEAAAEAITPEDITNLFGLLGEEQ
jgi:hypothetical protein